MNGSAMFSRTERCISSASARSAGDVDEPGPDRVGRVAERRPARRRRAARRRRPRRTRRGCRTARPGPGPRARRRPSDLARVEVEGDVARASVPRAQARARAMPRRRVGGRAAAGRRRSAGGRRSLTISPSISSTIRSSEPSVTSTTPTVSPSRRTVARSQTAAISIIRWEMKMTERSAPRWPADHLEHPLGQVRGQGRGHLVEQQHVGLDRQRAGQVDDPERGQRQVAARWLDEVEVGDAELAEPVAERLDRRLGQPQVRPDVEVRDERRLLVDGDDPAAPGLGRASWTVRLGRGRGSCRRPGWTAPVRILTSVLLPAPLAPISAWTSPGADRQRRGSQRGDGAVALGDAGGLEQQVGQSVASIGPVGGGVGEWAAPAEPAPPSGLGVRGGLLARALAGDELVLGVRRSSP